MSDALRILHGEFGRAMLVRANCSVAEHAHRTCQLLFKVDGPDIEVTAGKKRCILGNEDVAMFNAWERHGIGHVAEDSPVTLLGLHIAPSWLKTFERHLVYSTHPGFFLSSFGPIPNDARHAVRKFVELIVFEPKPNTKEVESLVLSIILAITTKNSESKSLSNIDVVSGIKCDPRIRKVLAMMGDSDWKEVELDDMARIACISRPHFFTLFKQGTGLTPMAYVNIGRMDSAFKKITETRNSLLNISLQLGFESPGNFSRFFKLQNAISPSQYRRSVTLLNRH